MRGRKPKSLAEHQRNGDPSKKGPTKLVEEHTPATVGGLFPDELREPPATLGPLAAQAYLDFVQDLQEAGIIDRGDRQTIISAAVAVGRAVEAGQWVNEYGMLYLETTIQWSERRQEEVERTTLKPNPAVAMERAALAEFRHLAEQLGLSPVARTRLGRAGVKGRPLDAELSGGGEELPVNEAPEGEGELPEGVIDFAAVAAQREAG